MSSPSRFQNALDVAARPLQRPPSFGMPTLLAFHSETLALDHRPMRTRMPGGLRGGNP